MRLRHGCVIGLVCCILVVGGGYTDSMAQSNAQERVTIQHEGFTTPQQRGVALIIDATIASPAGIRKAEVFCRPAGGRDFHAISMVSRGEEHYRAVVPDWMTAGDGLEYYISATDNTGRSTSHGFVGFPLVVRLVSARQPTRAERLKALEDTLEIIRRSRGAAPSGGYRDPFLDRHRYPAQPSDRER